MVIKNKKEIMLLKKAAKIAANVLKKVIKECRAGITEVEIAKDIFQYLNKQKCSLSFDTIVATGVNACELHHSPENTKTENGQMLLIDMGAKYENQNSDISRTFPVSKHFDSNQLNLYQALLDVQKKIIEMVHPDTYWNELQEMSDKLITKTLIKFKLLQENENTSLSNKAYLPFYPHKIGHWLGREVHEQGRYIINGKSRKLKAGMVLTIEPGIYIPKWKTGIRIEDDILVTRDGYEILSIDVPKEVKEIELLRKG